MEPNDIVYGLIQDRAIFIEFISSSKLSDDSLLLLVHVLAKACSCRLVENRRDLLLEVLNNNHVWLRLSEYVFSLPVQSSFDRAKNKLFWNNGQCAFWRSIITLITTFVDVMPTTATERVPKLVRGAIMTLERLEPVIAERDELIEQLKVLDERTTIIEKKKASKDLLGVNNIDEETPPDDFRSLQIYPEFHEIADKMYKPFLRRNVIEGAYRNVEHYLDVHFRLLREDFIAPLREGISSFFDVTVEGIVC